MMWLIALMALSVAGGPARVVHSDSPAVEIQRLPAQQRRVRHKMRKTAPNGGAELPPGRWTPETRDALENFITQHGIMASGYDQENPPAAVLIWEDVSVIGNPGEQAFRWMVNRGEFKFSDEFWALVPLPYRRRAKIGYNEFKDQPAIIWPKDPYYQMFRKAMFHAYQDLCKDSGRRACAAWRTQLLIGFDEGDISDYMEQVVEDELKGPVGYETIVEAPDDDLPLQMRTGLRMIPEMASLYQLLKKKGFDVWVFSSSNYWAARAFAARYGIDRDHIVGIHSKVVNRILQADLVEPIPVETGEAIALTSVVGHGAELAVGGEGDEPLFEYGPGLRLVIDRGDEKFRARALSRGWLVQPIFKSVPEGISR